MGLRIVPLNPKRKATYCPLSRNGNDCPASHRIALAVRTLRARRWAIRSGGSTRKWLKPCRVSTKYFLCTSLTHAFSLFELLLQYLSSKESKNGQRNNTRRQTFCQKENINKQMNNFSSAQLVIELLCSQKIPEPATKNISNRRATHKEKKTLRGSLTTSAPQSWNRRIRLQWSRSRYPGLPSSPRPGSCDECSSPDHLEIANEQKDTLDCVHPLAYRGGYHNRTARADCWEESRARLIDDWDELDGRWV